MDFSDSHTEWPYPVNYGKENEIEADVLVLGGGIAGCHAAINAARRGAKVAIVDKGAVIRSGQGGAGVDHWHLACTNPASTVTPEEVMEAVSELNPYFTMEYGNGMTCYITCRESWDTLQDVEQMGIKVRDVDDEFVGAEFRDDTTKLLFAYDYVGRNCIRVNGGGDIKVAMYREVRRLGIEIHDRVMVTSLLTEEGRQGGRVVGATGVNVRTGEFYIFKSKATVLSIGAPHGLWVFSTELAGSRNNEPTMTGEGTAIAWQAGAELTMMERTGPGPAMAGFAYPNYGSGNAHNTWYACTIVDAKGKEVPWVNRDGTILKNVADRYLPAPGQKYFLFTPGTPYSITGPTPISDLGNRIKNGEFTLPLYADLSSMPAHERRAIWGLMVANEGKGWIVYDTYSKAGYNPDIDMLQVAVLSPEQYHYGSWHPSGPQQWRSEAHTTGGGVLVDWDLKTSLEGLYAAGTSTSAGGSHATAATTGRYAGRKAAAYAASTNGIHTDRKQIDAVKTSVYKPIRSGQEQGLGWKEVRAGIARVMQSYCGKYKNEETLLTGLKWLQSIRESEASRLYARNPHELARALECLTHITVAEIIMHASLNRKASSAPLCFDRLDYPQMDPPEWEKLVAIKLNGNNVEVKDVPVNYWLKAPYAPTYAENYKKHSGL
ncbi:MAG TPA: FAD-dependent oxidoreductase, partial [Syntrophorhabdaceae bacterium]|nr:FAD-dependent oxidoreductase [Syntrophorhabdaceae bacterium]